ncbi:hypothetical protein LguiB_031716 [Lonicera macranthoides]
MVIMSMYSKLVRLVHGLVLVSNLCEILDVNTALLSMYSKLGILKDARLVFDKTPERDCVVWNLMISAYSNNGSSKESLEVVMQMVKCGIRLDLFTAVVSISYITDLKSIKQDKQMHAHLVRNGSDYQVSVHNSLIDMYLKSDCLMAARKSNIYAAAGKWDGIARVMVLLSDKGLKKTPGCSLLEINGQIHEFFVADT